MAIDVTQWGRRVELTGLIPVATATGFVALITEENIPDEAIDAGANSALNGGGDLRVATDKEGVNQLPLEVVNFVTSVTPAPRNAQLWVRFNSYETANRSVWLFYNKVGETQPPVTDPFGRNAVNQDYISRRHLENLALENSTGGATGTITGGVQVSAGKIGNSLELTSGASQRINLDGSLTGSIYTAECWYRHESQAAGASTRGIYVYRSSSSGTPIIFQLDYNLSTNQPRLIIRDDSGTVFNQTSSTVMAFNTWYKFVIVRNGNNVELFINGVSSVSGSASFGTITANTETLGAFISGGTYPDNTGGRFEEQSLAESAKDSDLISLEYQNQNSPGTFWTTGTPEDTVGAVEVNATLGTIQYDSVNPNIGLFGEIEAQATLGTIQYDSFNPTVNVFGDIEVSATLGTIEYFSGNATVSLTGDIEVTATLGTIEYDSLNPTVIVSEGVSVQPTIGTIQYDSLNPSVLLTGEDQVNATLGTIEYTSKNAQISLTGEIDVQATVGTIEYFGGNANVQLFGEIETPATLGTIQYDSINPVVSVSTVVRVESTLGTIEYFSANAVVDAVSVTPSEGIQVRYREIDYIIGYKESPINVKYR